MSSFTTTVLTHRRMLDGLSLNVGHLNSQVSTLMVTTNSAVIMANLIDIHANIANHDLRLRTLESGGGVSSNIDQRITQLEANVSINTSRNNIQDGRLVTLETDVASLKSGGGGSSATDSVQDYRLAAIEKEVELIKTAGISSSTHEMNQDQRLAKLEGNVAVVTYRVDVLESKGSGSGSGGGGITAHDVVQDGRLTALEADLSVLESEVAGIVNGGGSGGGSGGSGGTLYDASQDQRIYTLESEVATIKSSIGSGGGGSGASTHDQAQDQRIYALESSQTTQNTQIATLESEVAAIKSGGGGSGATSHDQAQDQRIYALESSQTTQDVRIDHLETSRTAHTMQISNFATEIGTIKSTDHVQDSRIHTVEQELVGLRNGTITTATDVSQDARLQTLEKDLADLIASGGGGGSSGGGGGSSEDTQQNARLDAIEADNTATSTRVTTIEGKLAGLAGGGQSEVLTKNSAAEGDFGWGVITEAPTGFKVVGSLVADEIYSVNNITAFYSDRRLKEDFAKVEDAASLLKKIDAYRYCWNERGRELTGFEQGERDVGLIAQEVQAIVPTAVRVNKAAGDGEDYLSVDYAKLVPLLVAEVKALREEMERLIQQHIKV